MRRLILMVALAIVALAATAPGAFGFGFSELSVTFTKADGSPVTQAGAHPYEMTTSFHLQSSPTPGGGESLDEAAKDIIFAQAPGFVGNPTVVPRCPTADFLTTFIVEPKSGGGANVPDCPDASAVGVARVRVAGVLLAGEFSGAIYNLEPPPGVPAKLGFWVSGQPIALELGVSESDPYNIVGGPTNIPQVLEVTASEFTLWGTPSDPSHDALRGHCLDPISGETLGNCAANISARPFLTLPRACVPTLDVGYEIDSWQDPDDFLKGFVETQDKAGLPQGTTGCGKLGFSPEISAQPTTKAASSPTGLDFSIDIENEGLVNPSGISNADVKKAVVTLPEGFSTNPSLAEGLGVCSEAQLARETAFSEAGAGCPDASKIGTVEVETPLLEEDVDGTLYVATPYENPEHSLIALYLVLKNEELGISIKQPLRVEPDPATGRLTTVAEDLPQLPFSHFRLHFREGTRSPLASPPGCGTYAASAELTPSSGGAPVVTTSAFQIIVGSGSGPCPSGGTPPFHPSLTAGTINNAAGSYSPFDVRLSRTDSEQEITHFSIKLPPGVTGKLAGIPFCSDQQIAAARSRERQPHGGQEEIEHPSCPQASEVGHTLVGAGVGPSLTYVPGKVYLAGPFSGSNLSIVAITAAKAGPFDLGTVVIREALKVNPETAEVSVDAGTSDPIPHIVDGIPVHLRDIRVYVDRPEFVRNPTNCEPTSTASTVLGSGTDFASEADDRPVTVTSRFQAADCASLGFKPGLKISLKGPTKRAGLPALTAVVTPRAGDANIGKAVVTLPPSEFLEQAHIGNSCTRVQFNSGAGNGAGCPANSVLGHAVAVTPLLGEPLEGPVFLRSNGGERKLPDLVAALHSKDIDIDLVGFIDSLHKKGSDVSQIRTTFAKVPDQPVTRFTLKMSGGKKGLLVNSTNLCKGTHKAISEFTGQNGKRSDSEPAVKAQCGKKKGGKAGPKVKAKAKKGSARPSVAILHNVAW